MEDQSIYDYFMEKYKDKKLLGLKDLAVELCMSERSIRNAIATGRFPIPTLKIGKFRMADKSDVISYLVMQANEGKKEFQRWKRLHGR